MSLFFQFNLTQVIENFNDTVIPKQILLIINNSADEQEEFQP
jgi:hypothetical protein